MKYTPPLRPAQQRENKRHTKRRYRPKQNPPATNQWRTSKKAHRKYVTDIPYVPGIDNKKKTSSFALVLATKQKTHKDLWQNAITNKFIRKPTLDVKSHLNITIVITTTEAYYVIKYDDTKEAWQTWQPLLQAWQTFDASTTSITKKKTQHDSKQAQASAFFSMPQQIDIYNMAQMKAWQRGKWARETGKHNSPSWQKTRCQEEQSPTPKNTTTTTTNKNAKAWPPSTIKNKACKSMTRVANFYTRPPLAQGMPLLQRAWLTSW